jgi:hypothetical protein
MPDLDPYTTPRHDRKRLALLSLLWQANDREEEWLIGRNILATGRKLARGFVPDPVDNVNARENVDSITNTDAKRKMDRLRCGREEKSFSLWRT